MTVLQKLRAAGIDPVSAADIDGMAAMLAGALKPGEPCPGAEEFMVGRLLVTLLDQRPAPHVLADSIDELDIGIRCYNKLREHGVRRLSQLESMTTRELRAIRGLGAKREQDLMQALASAGKPWKDGDMREVSNE